jgi:hypothetical protein
MSLQPTTGLQVEDRRPQAEEGGFPAAPWRRSLGYLRSVVGGPRGDDATVARTPVE